MDHGVHYQGFLHYKVRTGETCSFRLWQ